MSCRRPGERPLSGLRLRPRRRVLITGIGWVTPLGCSVEAVWEALLAGRSGIGPITRFDAQPLTTRFAGEVRDFEPSNWIDRKTLKRLDRFVQYALAASVMAAEDAAISLPGEDRDRVGAVVGSGAGGIETIEENHIAFLQHGAQRVHPISIPRMMINAAASQVAQRFGLRGPSLGVSLACATGAYAVCEAAEQIRNDAADVMIAGGSEASVTPLTIAGFDASRALSRRNTDPWAASRPFDLDRDGFVLSEGACVFVLEAEDHAARRDAPVYAEVAGSGTTCDAFHITAPDPSGESAARAIRRALETSGEAAGSVGYINAHGSATPLNDVAETRAIRRALGGVAESVPVSSTKSMLGHMLGAAGAVEAAITALALRHRVLPPTINVDHQDPDCDLDVLPWRARPAPGLRLALSNSFAFGGQNVVLALRSWPDQEPREGEHRPSI